MFYNKLQEVAMHKSVKTHNGKKPSYGRADRCLQLPQEGFLCQARTDISGNTKKKYRKARKKNLRQNKQERNPDSARNFAFMWLRPGRAFRTGVSFPARRGRKAESVPADSRCSLRSAPFRQLSCGQRRLPAFFAVLR